MKDEYKQDKKTDDVQEMRAAIVEAARGMTPEQRKMLIMLLEMIVGE